MAVYTDTVTANYVGVLSLARDTGPALVLAPEENSVLRPMFSDGRRGTVLLSGASKSEDLDWHLGSTTY